MNPLFRLFSRFIPLLLLPLATFAQSVKRPPPDAAPEHPPLYLYEGEQKMLTVPGLKRYSLGGDTIRALPIPGGRASRDELLIKAVHAGEADLWVWKSDGQSEHRTVEVAKGAPTSDLSPSLRRALSRLQETEVYYAGGDSVILRGEIESLAEARRLEAIVQAHPKEIHNETDPSPALLDAAKAALETWIQGSPWSQKIFVQDADRTLVIAQSQGSLSPGERARVESHARSIYPLVQVAVSSLPDAAPTVHFKVYLLELRKSRFHSLGLAWPSSAAGAFQVSPTSVTSQMQLDVALNMMAGDGSAKILSNPELVVRAPGEAELFSGGELPIQLDSAYYSNVTWKTFGLTLRLNVTHAAGDQVRLDVFTEVSHLDPSLSSQKIPGMQSNRLKTQVDAHFGKPLFLSGLLQQGVRKEARGLPGLRNIPVLGALFGSEDYLNENSELVAILVPSREVPAAPMDRVARVFPRGPLPEDAPAANPEERQRLAASPDFPWNVLR